MHQTLGDGIWERVLFSLPCVLNATTEKDEKTKKAYINEAKKGLSIFTAEKDAFPPIANYIPAAVYRKDMFAEQVSYISEAIRKIENSYSFKENELKELSRNVDETIKLLDISIIRSRSHGCF